MRDGSLRHKGLRERLVADLARKRAGSHEVLSAIGKVPRHLFLDSSFLQFAYKDMAFPIGEGQTISQPSTVAFQTTLLDPKPGFKVLEVGTGSGYQAAVLSELDVELFTIERQPQLYTKCSRLLSSLGYSRIRFFLGDGFEGLPTFAPFDGIIVTAGAESVPEKLLLQIKIGGCMVVPVGRDVQVMTRVTRLSPEEFERVEYGHCSFVPMLAGLAWNK